MFRGQKKNNVTYIPVEGNPNLVQRVETLIGANGNKDEKKPTKKTHVIQLDGMDKLEVPEDVLNNLASLGYGQPQTDQLAWLWQFSSETRTALLEAFKAKSLANMEIEHIRQEYPEWRTTIANLVRRFNFVKRVKLEREEHDRVKKNNEDRILKQTKRDQIVSILRSYLSPASVQETYTDPYLLKLPEIARLEAQILKEQNMDISLMSEEAIHLEFDRILVGAPKGSSLAFVRDQIYALDTQESRLVEQMEEILQPVLMDAMRPIYDFIGSIDATESYAQKHYKHFTPLIKNNKSLFEFKLNNRHLGDAVLLLSFDYVYALAGYKGKVKRDKVTVKPEKVSAPAIIGADIQYPELTMEQRDLIGSGFDLTHPGTPGWVWCMIGNQCLKFMLSFATYGAITMAAKELGYKESDLKALIDNDEIVPMFAQFVAHKFFTAQGGVAQSSSVYGSGQVQYRISSGFGTVRQANSKWIIGCKIWFKEKVFWGGNPNRQEKIDQAKRESEAAQREFNTSYNNFLDAVSHIDYARLTLMDLLDFTQKTQTLLLRAGEDMDLLSDFWETQRDDKEKWREKETAYFLARCEPERVLRVRDGGPHFDSERDRQFYHDNMTDARLVGNLLRQLREKNV